MAFKRRRNIETEKYVAQKQAGVMGGIDAQDLAKLIDAKGCDYYNADLNPTPGAREAYDNLGMTPSNSPMFALQQDLLEEMRGYYGLNTPKSTAVAPTQATAPLPRTPQRTMGRLPGNMRHVEHVDGGFINVGPEQGPMPIQGPKPLQGPKQAQAQQLKDETVNKILGYDVQKTYDNILNSKGMFTDSALTDAAILGGGSLALTGLAGLGGADGGDATAMGLLGAGVAAAPAIHNAVRNPSYRVPMKNGRGLVAAIAAGAGAGSGTSMLMDALGMTNQG